MGASDKSTVVLLPDNGSDRVTSGSLSRITAHLGPQSLDAYPLHRRSTFRYTANMVWDNNDIESIQAIAQGRSSEAVFGTNITRSQPPSPEVKLSDVITVVPLGA
ncbi:hypothetical protein LZ30DRAFT_780364 [Colletotrichum cereale]|nr:hypothetical protein LZ30DRAFT_780364 [Colletotrichum cereale]